MQKLNTTASSRIALKEQLHARLKAEIEAKGAKGKFAEIFLSSKTQKQLTEAFNEIYQSDLENIKSGALQDQYREKLFNETLMKNISAKQYKKRKNAFYILAYLVQTDPNFVAVALKQFHRIKDQLFKKENLPDLTSLEITADYLKFKVYVTQVVQEWIDKHSSAFPDLFIWKKIQSQYLHQEAPQTDLFSEKYHQLRIYQVIFQRNQGEIESLKHEFQKIKFECNEAKKLMEEKEIVQETIVEEVKGNQIEEEKVGPVIQLEPDEDQALDSNFFLNENYPEDTVAQTQITAPTTQKKEEQSVFSVIVINPNQFKANTKNLTLYRVISDNQKSIERRIAPLIEMFKVEIAFFQQIQMQCINAVKDKQEQDTQYKGRVKITAKEVQEFNSQYHPVSQEDISELSKEVESLSNKVNQLRKELNSIKLRHEIQEAAGGIFQTTRNNVEILDEEEEFVVQYEPDEADALLFK